MTLEISIPNLPFNPRRRSLTFGAFTSQKKTLICFRNLTRRMAIIEWSNDKGQYLFRRTLTPHQFLEVYVAEDLAHACFMDAETGDTLHAHYEEVFVVEGPDTLPMLRRDANITIPVYSLQERCLQILRDKIPKERRDKLSLPTVLEQALCVLTSNKSKINSILHYYDYNFA